MPDPEDLAADAADPVEDAEIPIFSKSALESSLAALGPELLAVIREEAAKFVIENRESVLELSQDVVKAVLIKDAFEKIAVPVIAPSDSLEVVARSEAYLAARSEIFSLVASAELKHAAQVAGLKAKARAVSAKIVGVVVGLGLKAVIGG